MTTKLDLKSITPLAKKWLAKLSSHAAFAFIIVVLIAYLFVVYRISSLATVEPSASDESAALAQADIPKVNKKAISQIQSLEQNSTAVHSLFEQARNNPFQE
jgi:hypothetical protein